MVLIACVSRRSASLAVPTLVVAVLFLLTGFGGLASPSKSGVVAPISSRLSVEAAPIHPIRHVVLILLENHNNQQTWGPSGTYLRYLDAKYANATSYYGTCHPSAPDYLALTSGRALQCGSDAYRVYNKTNVADLLVAKGLSWRAFDESMPRACDTHNSGLYAVRHNPLVYYQDIVQNRTLCHHNVVNSRYFNQSVSQGMLPNLTFYTPNLKDDCHNTPISYCDRWLKNFLSPILNATQPKVRNLVNHTLFIVTFDEGYGSHPSGYNGTAGGHLYFAAISPYSLGIRYHNNSGHYNLLSTVEWLFHLGVCGGKDGTSKFPPMKALFSFRSNGY